MLEAAGATLTRCCCCCCRPLSPALSACCTHLTFKAGDCPFNRLLGTAHARGFVQEFSPSESSCGPTERERTRRSGASCGWVSHPPTTNPRTGRVFVSGAGEQRAVGERGSVVPLRSRVYTGTFPTVEVLWKTHGDAPRRADRRFVSWVCAARNGWVRLGAWGLNCSWRSYLPPYTAPQHVLTPPNYCFPAGVKSHLSHSWLQPL